MEVASASDEAQPVSRNYEYEEVASTSALSSTGDQSRNDSPPAKRQRLQYHCAECPNVSFTEKRALARHKKTLQHMKSTGQEPSPGVQCIICGLSLTREYDRRRHMGRRHPGSWVRLNPVPSDEDDSPENLSAINDDIEMIQQPQSSDSHRSSLVLDQVEALTDAGGESGNSRDPSAGTSSTIGECGPTQMNGLEKPTSVKFKIPWKRNESGEETARSSRRPARPKPENRGSTIQRNGKYKTIPEEERHFCTLCDEPFEDDDSALQQHLRRHFNELNAHGAEFSCDSCELTFSYEADLAMHQQHAIDGDCRSNFRHQMADNDRHPPNQLAAHCSNPDACRYHLMLQNWRQAQLSAYCAEVNNPAVVRRADEGRVLSIEVAGHESQPFLESSPGRMRTFASAPCDIGKSGERDVRGLKRRLRKMSCKRTARGLFGKARLVIARFALRVRRAGGPNKALFEAAERADLSEMRQLLDLGADPNFVNARGFSVVATARRNSNPTLLELLVHYGATTELLSDDPLVHAALTDDVNGLESLIERGADVNKDDHRYGCALSAAAFKKNVASVQVLLREGADPNKHGGSYRTPLCSAIGEDVLIGRSIVEICDLLLRHGARPELHGPEGNALQSAITRLRSGKRRREEDIDDPIRYCQDLLERLSGHSWGEHAILRLLGIGGPSLSDVVARSRSKREVDVYR